ncbi:MAG: phage major capsid protein, P2 family [Burkholderiaceae bacterium]|nr:phage major capsid protein, P2 family [Burkholderiaceae bacterium]
MRNETRALFNAYVGQLATINGIPNATTKFTVEPTVQQRLEKRIQEIAAFLGMISIQGVRELVGDKIGLGVTGPIASRTDTSGAGERTPRDVKDLTETGYTAKQTNYDTAIKYATLDAWAKFPNFQAMLRDAIVQQQALDRIMIGFNGTSAAATTNLVANPLLQDVNIGWLKHIETDAPERVISEVVAASGEVTVGATGDYKNLDELVYEAVNSLIDPWHRESADLRVIIGREIKTDHIQPQIANNPLPSEREALSRLIALSRIGGVASLNVPYVPAGSILITIPKNLAIYYQDGGRRRSVIDNPKKDQIENYESSNDAYVVEDHGAACLIKNVTFV